MLQTHWNPLMLAGAAVLACGILLHGPTRADDKSVSVRATQARTLEDTWADLEKADPEATTALLELADHPAESVAFLKTKLKPLKLDPDQLKTLLAELGSRKPEVWQPAFEELEYFDPRLAIGLEALMADMRETPGRQRMVEVLSGRKAGSLEEKKVELRKTGNGSFNFTSGGAWWAEVQIARLNSSPGGNLKKKWTRAVRAIAFLEHVGTPDATAILKRMAFGHEEAQPTREARKALKRLADKAR
ncbi:hypothetical protein ACYOEI_11605 [Singulisphaera rosea]